MIGFFNSHDRKNGFLFGIGRIHAQNAGISGKTVGIDDAGRVSHIRGKQDIEKAGSDRYIKIGRMNAPVFKVVKDNAASCVFKQFRKNAFICADDENFVGIVFFKEKLLRVSFPVDK